MILVTGATGKVGRHLITGLLAEGAPVRALTRGAAALGMAVAVLLDATLVRMVATPAVLQLLGRANWWFLRLSRSRGTPG